MITSRLPKSVQGGAAGFIATFPMTAFMELMYRRAATDHTQPLPPRRIVDRASRAVGASQALEVTHSKPSATIVAHLAFGSAAGALYPPFAARFKSPVLSGVGFGAIVWAASYLGIMPFAHLLPPVTRLPKSHTLTMLGAHILWGATLGLCYQQFKKTQTNHIPVVQPPLISEPEKTFGKGTRDRVDENSWESFPGSDAPAY